MPVMVLDAMAMSVLPLHFSTLAQAGLPDPRPSTWPIHNS